MIIKPRTRGFICTTAHPVGCAQHVQEQIDYVLARPAIHGPRNVLVIGASAGYGLASRITAAFGARANTIGVYRPSNATATRTASAGWYNSAAFEKAAQEAGLKSLSVTGDAFSDEVKAKTVEAIREELGQVDLVVYSVASGRRTHPRTGETSNSVLKPIGEPYTNKTVNFHTGEVSSVTLEPATEEEVQGTVEVMGGEDWKLWIDALRAGGVLADNATTFSFSYIGSDITQAIYREGSIGSAKDHLEATARQLNDQLKATGGRAFVAVTKGLVTQSSSAIPVVPLYISALYKVMKEKGLHEGCIEQSYRLFAERLYAPETTVDEEGRIRIDDWELREDVQAEVANIWEELTTQNIYELSDLEGYRREFFQLFGFEFEGVEYDADIDPIVNIPNVR
ncbi:trans-2-enoyl-CoA reductase family protein [Paenibacillus polymyxa]|uniref:Trans-2-enoyl-CoA reductase [NADH] n=1 Tax=Paenibacillus polymyxa TaxID=1406 RepID=A0A378Y4C4_PAEPO|nr:enoyl-ACP reductase FabV [Paenibacillus polymyxa]MBE7899193.1 trans-2-enoyl-CoA reductase family protein [Paenibacillus polymyxa]MBG9766966.1 trans-2-enoyl-CoA reductase [Paenibacillus polymyxa]MCC3258377.1 trans-2-enoyl-CoA reductase family protein [Paenibacillus polymyxa]QPK53935.1 trans-2-enoyl-CoA reductase family protein [Paenibacillus polymyxa]QPK59022.1 trans-2-enoyl-CoA reductase family protein [Paenibacillus polymyxa]